jgi:hypothetical protein
MRMHTTLVQVIRNYEDDANTASQRYPGVPLDMAIKKLIEDELNNCTKTGRLTGTITILRGPDLPT